MEKDINKNTYDEATLTKLEIFEQYLIELLPVFIHTPDTAISLLPTETVYKSFLNKFTKRDIGFLAPLAQVIKQSSITSLYFQV